ncbi:BrnA antitoxin family protein [Rhizobiaceae bacterium LC148]|nr:BrnA antitoxin family protein [Rhizobium sp. LC145]TKT42803.1 BrnA antitoxin family protein [Rhizobiaceae bacterium LC148]
MAIRIVPAPEPKPTDRVQQVMDHQAGKKRTRSPNGRPRKLLSLRIDQEVIDHFKATGEGWQARMNDALRKAAGL